MTAVFVALIIIAAVVAAVAGSSVRILREYERVNGLVLSVRRAEEWELQP